MTDEHHVSREGGPDGRGERIAHSGDEASNPQDLQDTWNTPDKTWSREQTPVDVFGQISDEDINDDQAGGRAQTDRQPRSGV